MRDDSRFGRSQSNRGRSKSGGNRGKSQERPESDLFKKVKDTEKKVDELTKTVNSMKDMITNKLVNVKFVEEEIVIDVKFVDETRGLKMIVDSGAPLSIVSERWFKRYIEEKAVDERELKYKHCVRRFRMGKNVYMSRKEIRFQIVIRVENDDYIKREMTANIIENEEELFLCGRQTLTEWKIAVFFENNRL